MRALPSGPRQWRELLEQWSHHHNLAHKNPHPSHLNLKSKQRSDLLPSVPKAAVEESTVLMLTM